MELIIREWTRDDSISDLTLLVRSAYKQLSDMGLKFWGTWQTDDVTADRIRDAKCTLIALQGNTMVATISLYPPNPESKCEHYHDAWCFGQFGVLPDVQGTGIGSKMLGLVEQRVLAEGGNIIALDTAEPATHLIRYYEKRGYSFVQHQQWEKVNYRSVILSKRLSI